MRYFFKIRSGENYNHPNILKYFEYYHFSLTQTLGKISILGQPPGDIALACQPIGQ